MGKYKSALHDLQVGLVMVQRHLIAHGRRVLVIFEGRDASGKDGTIKRITAHMSPRETRVVALGRPSDRERTQWYFQRFASHLPAAGEVALFNRSWYNRAGVERVMGYCTKREHEAFMRTVVPFETMLAHDGIQIIKYYLDISRDEQRKRLEDRDRDPLKQWKVSPVDSAAIRHWADYSRARNAMLEQTTHPAAPWLVVRTDNKKTARLNVIRDLLTRIECPDRAEPPAAPDPEVVFGYQPGFESRLAP